jgi:hypothetical protein
VYKDTSAAVNSVTFSRGIRLNYAVLFTIKSFFNYALRNDAGKGRLGLFTFSALS